MKIIERKKLMTSQRQLINLKIQLTQEAVNIANMRQQDINATKRQIAEELGIDPEKDKYQFSKDGEYVEILEEEKLPESPKK